MSENREKSIVDFNQSRQTSSTARPPLQMHNFMSMLNSTLYDNQQIEETGNSLFMNQLNNNIKEFWRERQIDIIEAPSDVRGQHALPLTRIKKVIKSDEEVKMVSADTPVVFSKACEVFIMELTLRAWMHTQENNRRTLQRSDVANAIRDEGLLLFLNDIVPMETYQEAELQLVSHHGAYVPFPIQGTPMRPPNYPLNMQSMSQSEVAPGGHAVATDHRLASPTNSQHNINVSFFERINQEMQENSRFPPPLAPANEDNPFLGFKNFWQ